MVIFFWSWILETALCFKSCWKEEMTAWVLGCIYILTGIYCSDLFARNAQTLPFSSQLSSPWKSKLARNHHFFLFLKSPNKKYSIIENYTPCMNRKKQLHPCHYSFTKNKKILELYALRNLNSYRNAKYFSILGMKNGCTKNTLLLLQTYCT